MTLSKRGHFLFILHVLITAASIADAAVARVTIDPSDRHQTIEGWGATLSLHGIPFVEWAEDPTAEQYDRLPIEKPVPDGLRTRIIEEAVVHLGLNRFRLEIGPQVEFRNDNDDPHVINAAAYRFAWQDAIATRWLVPLKHLIEHRGEKLVLYISYDLSRAVNWGDRLTPPWLLEPREYAEMALATLGHLKESHGLEVDYWAVLNEPGHGGRPGNPDLLAQILTETSRRIQKAGYRTRMCGPEVHDIRHVTPYLEALRRTPGGIDHLAQITFHLYGHHNNVAHRKVIRNWANILGVTAAQTEWHAGVGLQAAEVLHLDLTVTGVSSWEQYGLAWPVNAYSAKGGADYFLIDEDYRGFRMNTNAWYLRHYMKYVRPGAVRIGARSDTSSIKPVAFVTPSQQHVAVIINANATPADIEIDGLQSGSYEVSSTADGHLGEEHPTLAALSGVPARVRLPARSVLTISPQARLRPESQRPAGHE